MIGKVNAELLNTEIWKLERNLRLMGRCDMHLEGKCGSIRLSYSNP
jgi:hypothetical protein